jgi:hypothetical protein
MKRLLLIPTILLATVIETSLAAENSNQTIRLLCAYSYTIDSDGKRSDTSGEDLFTVMYAENGQAKIRKQGLSSEFSGKISEEKIVGEVTYKVTNIQFTEFLVINRFTGAFQISFGAVGKGGLIHFGTCRPVTKPLF